MPSGLRANTLRDTFETALPWNAYLDTDPGKAIAWRELHDRIQLNPEQIELLQRFTRRMPVLMVSGIWCGDCVRQGPVLHALATTAPCIDLRFIDRDADESLRDALAINNGHRVPVVLFMAEDHEPVSAMGDRTLRYYRHIAATQLGANCPLPGAPTSDDLLTDVIQDWIDELERVHLLLRLSGRLRTLHGD